MNPAKPLSVRLRVILAALVLSVFLCADARGDDWALYGGSRQGEVHDSTLREWYGLNRFEPVSPEEATSLHYYDRDSVARNSPFPGGIVRVWEKSVIKKETSEYEAAKAEIEAEEAARLKRKITVLDYAWIFPMAVNRATKEIATLYDFNCDTREFFIVEVNTYDKAGKRMTREVIADKYFWSPVRAGTLLDILSLKVCE